MPVFADAASTLFVDFVFIATVGFWAVESAVGCGTVVPCAGVASTGGCFESAGVDVFAVAGVASVEGWD